METQARLSIPLKLNIHYEEPEDLNNLIEDEPFRILVLENALAALKQAIRKNKSECVLFDLVNYNYKVKINKSQYKLLIDKIIKYYEVQEEYVKCKELVKLKSRL